MRIEWIAARDRIAHAVRAGHRRALCGVRAVDPRWAWPASSRCHDCQVLADINEPGRRVLVHRPIHEPAARPAGAPSKGGAATDARRASTPTHENREDDHHDE